MTEGPKYKLWALRLKRLIGQRLVGIVLQGCLCNTVFAWLGWRLARVFKVGKELYLVFEPEDRARPHAPRIEGHLGELASRSCLETGEQVLKVHFGHGGGYRVQPARDGKPRKAWGNGYSRIQHREEPAFEMQLCGGCLAVWFALGGHSEIVTFRYLKLMEGRLCRDIDQERFAYEQAVELLARSSELIVDALMNQALLPGVGNVIKIEGLFAAGVHPLRAACQLSRSEALALLRAVRDFADRWYHAPGQRCGRLVQIYGKKVCCRCGGRTLKICEGTRQRLTYFCQACQPFFRRRWRAEHGARSGCAAQPVGPSARREDAPPRKAPGRAAEEGDGGDDGERLLLELAKDRLGIVLQGVDESEAPSDPESADQQDSSDADDAPEECSARAPPPGSGPGAALQTFY